ncbi:ABC transporter permease [Chloroflexota bacterium]
MRWYRDHQNLVLGVAGVLGFIVLWQLAAILGLVNTVFTSSPVGVFNAALREGSTGGVWLATSVTIREFLIGFGVSALVGIPVGIMVGWYRLAYGLLNPFISALYAVPRLALLPIFVLWFGIGMQSRLALVFSVALLPIIVNTALGIRMLEQSWIRVARSFGANDAQIFRTVALPGSVPNILGGLRIGVGQGMVAVIASELFIGREGLGGLLNWYGASFLMAELMFVIILVAALGIAVVAGLARIEKQFECWRPSVQE